MKTTISRCSVRGGKLWRVLWFDLGRVHRKFFDSRAASDSFAATLKEGAITSAHRLSALPKARQSELLLIHDESEKRGVDLVSLLTLLTSAKDKPKGACPSIASVLEEMEITKRKAGRDSGYLGSLRQIVGMFSAGREQLALNIFTVHDVEAFLNSKNRGSRSTLRSRLSTMFKFAMRRGYLTANPCAQLEPISFPSVTPSVFTLGEMETALEWLKLNPRLMAWFCLSTFCGLRPEEAEKTSWKEINFDEGWVKVESQTTKTRQRRVVYPMAVAMDWLRLAKRLKSELPLTTKQRAIQRNLLRTELGWTIWKQDVTRHTAASMWLAHCGSCATVATALGHSESILRFHYMALVTKAEAEKFWALTPGTVNNFPNSKANSGKEK